MEDRQNTCFSSLFSDKLNTSNKLKDISIHEECNLEIVLGNASKCAQKQYAIITNVKERELLLAIDKTKWRQNIKKQPYYT